MIDAEEEVGALRASGRLLALTSTGRRLAEAPQPRPLPSAPPGMLGLAMVGRRAAAVWALSSQPRVWVAFEGEGGAMICGGDEVAPLSDRAELLRLPAVAPTSLPQPHAVARRPARLAVPAVQAPIVRSGYVLTHGRHAVIVSLSTLDGLGTLPSTPPQPLAASLPGARGMIEAGGRVALLLDPAWCTGRPPDPFAAATLVALLRVEDRLLAMPVGRAVPGHEGTPLEDRLRATPEGRDLLAAAPPARPPPVRPPGETIARLLVCEAGGNRFAVAAAEISTVIAPLRPAPAPAAGPALRGVVSHRGEVLPVLDLDRRLGAPLSAAALATAPLLRLLLARPVAVPVDRVLGLRAVPVPQLAAVAEDPIVSSLAPLDGGSVPVCRAARLPSALPA